MVTKKRQIIKKCDSTASDVHYATLAHLLLTFLICSLTIVQIHVFYKQCSKLYALDTTLDLKNPTKAKLEEAMKGHIIEKTEYVGTFAAKSA